jgi:hypothetical protein
MDLPDKSVPQPAKKKVEPLVGSSATRARPVRTRFFDFMFAESPKTIMKNVLANVIVPRAKAGLEEAGNNFLASMFWGDPSNRPMSNVVRGTVVRGGMVNYSGISQGMMPQQMAQAASPPTGGNYNDIVFGSLQDAEVVLAGMYALLNDYRIVALGDLKEMSNQPTAPSDNGFGWMSLDGARISKVRDGYALELPRPTRI